VGGMGRTASSFCFLLLKITKLDKTPDNPS